MKKLVLILVIPFLVISCSLQKKTTTEEDYNVTINKLVNKLLINPDNQKNIQILSIKLDYADKTDLKKISELKITRQADIWYEVFMRYFYLNRRQELIEKLPINIQKEINFKKQDYSQDLEIAKMKSTNYLYAKSKQLLENGNDSCSKSASENLLKITKLYKDFRDVDKLLRRSLIYGSKNVLYRFYNKSKKTLPNYQKEYIRSIEISQNSFFDFDNNVIPEKDYDFSIVVNVNKIVISPGTDSEKSHYVSKGTEEKATKYRCKVIEIDQNKSVVIYGVIEYYDNKNSKQVYSKPISVKTNFNYRYARLKGDELACSPEVIEMAKKKRIIFPSDNKMLEDAIVKMKTLVETLIIAE